MLDKRGPGAGASGIACGTVRNNYFQPAMRELMAHSVSVWESDPEAFSYHPVGFLQIAPEAMAEDVAQIYAEQRAIGYPSVLVEGKSDCQRYLLGLVRGLAGAREHHRAAREEGRLREQHPRGARPGGEGGSGGGADRFRRPRHRVRHRRGRGDLGRNRSGHRRVRSGGDRGRPVDPRPVGLAGPAGDDHGGGAGRDRRRGPADVDLLGAAGGHARDRAVRVHRQRGRLPARDPRGLRRAALRRHQR